MFAMRAEWLADRPEFDRVLERMREANRLPEVRDSPAWKAGAARVVRALTDAGEEAGTCPGAPIFTWSAQPLPEAGCC